MKSSRLGNFPLQRLSVRGDSMRVNDAANNSFSTSVRDPAWLLARIWPYGEFSATDAGSPLAKRLEKRARKLIGKVVVIQRLGGAGGQEPDIVQIKRLIKVDHLENGSLGFWVEGDNKSASTDSRHWGYLKAMEIRGVVVIARNIF